MLMLHVPAVIPTQWEWLAILLLIGSSGLTAQFLLSAGLQRETAGRGTMAIYAQIVFAAADELLFFHTMPSLLSAIGTAIILTSAIYVALTKQKMQSKTHANRTIVSEDPSLEEGLFENHEDDPQEERRDQDFQRGPSGAQDN
ncbi:hypothetical protein C8Q79DRAFT_262792 [Trametes meyenii]|nr:hypothetical protein C8Q79DRAFT_262792 [Trametes meyenii]